MGFHHSTYFAYGIQIPDNGAPWQMAERLEAELPKLKDQCPDVGFLQAGNYDDDMTFLTTRCDEVGLGEFKTVTPQTATGEQLASWNGQLVAAAAALGIADPAVPGWIVVPDLD
ncbi:hypothetical protein [Streptomyces cucumeris]|uniref:hypothetical protein n=1 Tax=Streptomyces cucumeris TaxID=2962890 RepID=UPI0020C85763|nr:hypothetical protein [Streptomyces sp. NEAU-Y11]MCP9205543.1 hypothetical protein [Streptomyces sp. NEAU-Y11]